MTFLMERIEETLSGYTAAVVVNVFGNDLDVLDQKAQEIARALGEIHGATDVAVQSPPGLPQLTIRLRKPDLERWGFDAVEVLDLIRTAYQGDVVGQTYEGSQVFNVITILDDESRDNITKIGACRCAARAVRMCCSSRSPTSTRSRAAIRSCTKARAGCRR